MAGAVDDDVDDAGTALVEARRERVWAAMERAGLDVLVLGRGDDVAYTTGMASLWTAGTRPFGPACVLVAAGRAVHVLSSWDAGLPADLGIEHCYGISWNPAVIKAALGAIPGLASARRLGVDALSPGFGRAIPRLAPEATVVPVDDLLRAVRRTKLPAELDRIRRAVAVAREGVDAAGTALVAGSTAGDGRVALIEAVARRGRVVPSSAPVVRPVDGGEGRALADGDEVVVDAGVLVAGYEGGCGRTLTLGSGSGSGERAERVRAAHGRLMEACRPGSGLGELRAAAAGTTSWMVRGTGMGFEPPMFGATVPEPGADDGPATLQAGMVLSVEATADGARHREIVLVGDAGSEVF